MAENRARFHEGQFVRSISLPSVELRVLRYVPANNAWACRIEGGFAVEFPEQDLVVANVNRPKGRDGSRNDGPS